MYFCAFLFAVHLTKFLSHDSSLTTCSALLVLATSSTSTAGTTKAAESLSSVCCVCPGISSQLHMPERLHLKGAQETFLSDARATEERWHYSLILKFLPGSGKSCCPDTTSSDLGLRLGGANSHSCCLTYGCRRPQSNPGVPQFSYSLRIALYLFLWGPHRLLCYLFLLFFY